MPYSLIYLLNNSTELFSHLDSIVKECDFNQLIPDSIVHRVFNNKTKIQQHIQKLTGAITEAEKSGSPNPESMRKVKRAIELILEAFECFDEAIVANYSYLTMKGNAEHRQEGVTLEGYNMEMKVTKQEGAEAIKSLNEAITAAKEFINQPDMVALRAELQSASSAAPAIRSRPTP